MTVATYYRIVTSTHVVSLMTTFKRTPVDATRDSLVNLVFLLHIIRDVHFHLHAVAWIALRCFTFNTFQFCKYVSEVHRQACTVSKQVLAWFLRSSARCCLATPSGSWSARSESDSQNY